MIKARICYTETATGGRFTFDAELVDLSCASVVLAMNQEARKQVEDWENLVPVAMSEIEVGRTLGFIFRDDSQKYFGPMIYAGVVYTNFI